MATRSKPAALDWTDCFAFSPVSYAYLGEMYAYNVGMIRHTSLNLDMDLVEEARRVLKTKQVTETVHRALQEVVSAEKRASLARRRLDLTPTSLRSMRRARTRRLSERFPAAR
jgi:Arc/MetJ family transcription regulator